MKILVINGPNINFLGIREPEIYGKKTYGDLCKMINEAANRLEVDVELFQSNHEGDIVDCIQRAYFENTDGIVINPAAYTHTSVAILDALKAVNIPAVEVHISKLSEREEYRQVSFVREFCFATVSGHGFEGYVEAMEELIKRIKNKE